MDKLFTFDGRASRMGFLGINCLALLLIFLAALTESEIFFDLVAAVVIFILLCVNIRRLHDLGMSGWWAILFYPLTLPMFPTFKLVALAKKAIAMNDGLLVIIVMLGIVVSLVAFSILAFCPGTKGDNRFGPPTNLQDGKNNTNNGGG